MSDKILWIAFIAILFILCEIICYLSKAQEKFRIMLKLPKILLILFCCMVGGSIYMFYFNYFNFNEVKLFDNEIKEVIGTISNEGINKNTYWEYILKNNVIEGKSIRSKILLRSKEKLEYGSKVRINGILEIPKGARNQNTFDYSKYLKTLNVYIILEAQDVSVLKKQDIFLIEKVSYLVRNKVREFSKATLNRSEAGILNALVIGDDSTLENNLEESYKKAGMIHLLVVSGGHTVFLIMLLKFIFSFIGISKNASKILYIFIIFLYIFITGATTSILRAGIGIIIIIIAELIGRQNDGFTTAGVVAFILLINNPNTLFSLSFLLSFGGVIGIMLCYPKIRELLNFIPNIIAEPLALTLSAQLFVTPITIYSFNSVYLGGIISNLFSLSLSGIIMMAGIILFICYLFLPFVVFFPMKIVSILIFIMNKIAEIFGSIDLLVLYVITPGVFSIALYYGALLYIFVKKGSSKETSLIIIKYPRIPSNIRRNYKKLVIIFVSILIFISNIKIIDFDKSLKISMIDVGHGDSILITTPNDKHILIDTGDKYYQGEKQVDFGEQVIVPYLLKQGIKSIDLLILTHMDSDHIGGYESIVNIINVKTLGLSVNSGKKEKYKNIRNIAIKNLINIKSLKRGDKFEIDGVKFKVLMPQRVEEVLEENNDSIVLMVEYKNKKILFMGDLEKDGEKELINLEKELDVDVIKVGHHGSITSSSEEFINKITPEIALISVGNRFKSIPGKEVLNRLDSVHSKVYRTDKMGEINVIIDNRDIKVKTTY